MTKKWISVKKSLPKEDSLVLARANIKTGSVDIFVYSTTDYNVISGWEAEQIPQIKITHWMKMDIIMMKKDLLFIKNQKKKYKEWEKNFYSLKGEARQKWEKKVWTEKREKGMLDLSPILKTKT